MVKRERILEIIEEARQKLKEHEERFDKASKSFDKNFDDLLKGL